MATADVLVTGGEIVSGAGYRRADVAVTDGVITEVAPDLRGYRATVHVDATGQYVLPGLMDAHNHPYYDEDLEQFSRAAAFGGITTLLSFVTGQPAADGGRAPVIAAAADYIQVVGRSSYLDCGGHAILSADDIGGAIAPLRSLGFGSFKVFLAFPGTRMLTDDQVYTAMRAIAEAGGICMVHCENGPVTDLIERDLRARGRTGGEAYLASRPAELEAEAVYRALSLAALAGCPAYIVHVSAAESMRIIADFRHRGGPPVFAETCLHYLCLTGAEQVALGPRAKISPPCRSAADTDALWERVTGRDVDVIATDASGQILAKKEAAGADYLAAPYGIPGVEDFVRVLAARAAGRGIDPLPVLARSLAERPAEIFGIADRKGSVEPGKDGDLAIFDPRAEWTVRAAREHGRSDYSLYEGQSGTGCVTWTCQRGQVVLADGEVRRGPGDARFLASSR
jgi:dihydropyrimidinase